MHFEQNPDMIKNLLTLIFLLLFTIQSNSQNQNKIEYLESQYLNDSIPIRVFKSDKFDVKTDSINLIVLLDGDSYSGIAINTIDLYEFANKVNSTIIVSLPSTIESRWEYFTPTNATPREADLNKELYKLTGGFKDYSNFIEKELIPFIENENKIQFTNKTLFGHSLGGLAVLNFIVLNPGVFDSYICASPSTMYDNHFIFETIKEKEDIEFKNLYLTAAENDGNGYKGNVEWLNNYLEKKNQSNQGLRMKIFPGQIHTTSGIYSLIEGIDFLSRQNAL